MHAGQTHYTPVDGTPCAPTRAELAGVLDKLIVRLLRMLTRQGHLMEEQGVSYIADIDADYPFASLQGACCTYRIALTSARRTEGAEP